MRFSQEERALLATEDNILNHPSTSSSSARKGLAQTLIQDWKIYGLCVRDDDGKTPKLKVAVRHAVSLLAYVEDRLSIDELKIRLSYGRDSILTPSKPLQSVKINILDVPIDANRGELFAVSASGKLFPYKFSTHDVPPLLTMDKINVCSECPVAGLCDIIDRCTGYISGQYELARQSILGPEIVRAESNPTLAEYREFERIKIPKK